MSDQTIKLMQLLKENKTCNEICAILNISNKQLYNNLTNLRNKGLLYKRKYYSNGAIIYKGINTWNATEEYLTGITNAVITTNDEKNIKFLLISDLHVGNELERLDLVSRAYEYCAKKGIHIILCGGDMIDGTYTAGNQKIEDTFMQIEHFIKDYPFDKNILTFAVAGDHDHSALYSGKQNIIEIAKNYRHDIIIGGYLSSFVKIKNDQISLLHNIGTSYALQNGSPILIQGHLHKYKTTMCSDDALLVTVPSLSDINQSLPTAVEMELEFNKGFISSATLKQIYFADRDYILNEVNYDLSKRQVEIGPIKFEEKQVVEDLNPQPIITETKVETPQVEIKVEEEPKIIQEAQQSEDTNKQTTDETPKVKVKDIKRLSQIEKFQKRLGK